MTDQKEFLDDIARSELQIWLETLAASKLGRATQGRVVLRGLFFAPDLGGAGGTEAARVECGYRANGGGARTDLPPCAAQVVAQRGARFCGRDGNTRSHALLDSRG